MSGLAVLAGLIACNTASTVTGTTSTSTLPAFLIVKNFGSVPATVVVDLQVPVQTSVAVSGCHTLSLMVPISDSVKIVVSDSGSATSATYPTPLYQSGVWGLNAAANSVGPIPLGAIGQVPTSC